MTKVPKDMADRAKEDKAMKATDPFKKLFTKDPTVDAKRIICPYCGYIDNYPYEYIDEHGTIICDECEKEFVYMVNITVKYSTYKKDV